MTDLGWILLATATALAMWIGVRIGRWPARWRQRRLRVLVALLDAGAQCQIAAQGYVSALELCNRDPQIGRGWVYSLLAELADDGLVEIIRMKWPSELPRSLYRLTLRGTHLADAIRQGREIAGTIEEKEREP